MSAGDIDDRLGPEGELERLCFENEELGIYITEMDSLPIERASIPFGAGISQDGQTRYIDSRINCDLNGTDVSICLVTHESVEWALREFCGIGEDYASDPRGHRLANRAEYEKVADLFGVVHDNAEDVWMDYDDFIDPQIRAIEHDPLANVPKDLALYPYAEDSVMLRKIKEAQNA